MPNALSTGSCLLSMSLSLFDLSFGGIVARTVKSHDIHFVSQNPPFFTASVSSEARADHFHKLALGGTSLRCPMQGLFYLDEISRWLQPDCSSNPVLEAIPDWGCVGCTGLTNRKRLWSSLSEDELQHDVVSIISYCWVIWRFDYKPTWKVGIHLLWMQDQCRTSFLATSALNSQSGHHWAKPFNIAHKDIHAIGHIRQRVDVGIVIKTCTTPSPAIQKKRSLRKTLKSVGPRTDPWEAPIFIKLHSLHASSTLTG